MIIIDSPSTVRVGYVAEDIGQLPPSGSRSSRLAAGSPRPSAPAAALRRARGTAPRSRRRSARPASPWPWVTSQRGLSGIARRNQMIPMPSTGPTRKPIRQPASSGTSAGSSRNRLANGTEPRAGPVGAVDRDVDPTAIAGRDQLVDRRVDRRILAADAHAGDEPPDVEEPRRGREPGDSAPDQVDQQGDDEELASSPGVGETSEGQRTDDLAQEVAGSGQRHRLARPSRATSR